MEDESYSENMRYELLSKNDMLSSYITSDKRKIKFVMANVVDAYNTLSTNSRFSPNPCEKLEEIYGKKCTIKDVEDFVNIIMRKGKNQTTIFLDKIIKFFDDRKTDLEFVEDIKELSFIDNPEIFLRLLYFFIFSCKTSINCIFTHLDIAVWEINNLYELKMKFHTMPGEEKMLFHGTKANCIFSITREFLKVMSGGPLMSTAAAYGNGIYASDSISFASGYSVSTSEDASPWRYILVLKCKNLNKKAHNIYVQQPDDILICGVICIPKNSTSIGYGDENYKPIVDKLITSMVFTPPTVITTLKNISRAEDSDLLSMIITTDQPSDRELVQKTRLQKEFKKLLDPESRSEYISRVNFQNPKDITSPLLIELKPYKGTPLRKQCDKHHIPGIIIAFYFHIDSSETREKALRGAYPIIPPTLRVVKPIFEQSTGRISLGGSICMDTLYATGWSPSYGLDSICAIILDIISNENQEVNNTSSKKGEPGGIIDISRIGDEYKYSDFLASYNNTSVFHKWKPTVK